jgi:DNA-binding response OmpR family regulator
VIEDNLDIKEVLDYILQYEGHEVIVSADDTLSRGLDGLQPDLILMDEILEGVRGSDLIRKLKNEDTSCRIPMVLISAIPDLKDVAEKCGADAYLEKPFNIDTLTDLLKKFA